MMAMYHGLDGTLPRYVPEDVVYVVMAATLEDQYSRLHRRRRMVCSHVTHVV